MLLVLFCTSRGAMCAGSAQVTLVELKEGVTMQVANQTGEQNTRTPKQPKTKTPKSPSSSITIFWSLLRQREFLRSFMVLPWPRVFFLCRFPSMVNAEQFSSNNLYVIGEDEIKSIFAAVSGKHPVDIIICGMQSRLQDNLLQLFHLQSQLRHVILFHECFFNASSVDLTVGVCASLKRCRAHIQRISKYKSFDFAQAGGMRTITKATYFIALSAARKCELF